MSANTTYNAKFVTVADKVILALVVVASAIILLAGVNAHNGASASTPSPTAGITVVTMDSTGGAHSSGGAGSLAGSGE